MKLLSKSKYMNGLQCLKYLWFNINDKDKIPDIDAGQQHRFDEGHAVGELAKKLYPEGIDIETEDFKENLRKTKELLLKKKPLFEAAISVDNIYARADILVPAKDGWDIVEVKSSTQVKPEHILDVSFQRFCFEKAGLKINKCYVMHVNNQYVKNGNIDPKKYFIKEEVETNLTGISDKITEMSKVMDLKSYPNIPIGKYCDNPYECPLKHICWKSIPKFSVFDLTGGKGWKLFEQGIINIKDIPKDFELNPKQQIQVEAFSKNKIHIDKKGIKSFLDKIEYPIHYFHFVGIWDDHIPFLSTFPFLPL